MDARDRNDDDNTNKVGGRLEANQGVTDNQMCATDVGK